MRVIEADLVSGNNLLFITDRYPFGTGEYFIENEIEYLSRSFDNVFIVSKLGGNNPRTTPRNVKVYKCNEPNLYDGIKALFSRDFWLSLSDCFPFRINNAIANFALIYKSQSVISAIREIITENNLNSSNTSLYSYWFMHGAYAITVFDKEYNKVSRAHGYDIYDFRAKYNYQPLKYMILDKISHLRVASQDGALYLKGKHKKHEKKIGVSYLGTPENQSHRNSTQLYFTILSCSNCIALKRVDLLAEVLSKLKLSSNVKVKWLHIGSGPTLEEVKSIVNSEYIPNFECEFMGEISNKEVHAIYQNRRIDLFVSLSETEGGVPVSMMEAQSYGTPILATRVGGIPEIVVEGSGTLVDIDMSTEKICREVEKYLYMPISEISLVRARAIENWKNNFNCDHNYNSFIKDYLLPKARS